MNNENIKSMQIEKKVAGSLLRRILDDFGTAIMLVIMCIVFTLVNPNFISIPNLMNILRQVSIFGIMAAGMTMVLICGHIDLSVGSVVAFAGIITTLAVQSGAGMFVACVIGTLSGAAVGIFNGVLTTRVNIPSFLITLGSMQAVRGLGEVITGGRSIGGMPEWFAELGTGYIWVIPKPVVVMIIVLALAYFFLKHTRYGRYIYATGGNKEAARLSGINTKVVITAALAICSMLAGLSGVIWASRLNSGQPIVGLGYELQVIAACVIGGTSLSGGKGRVLMSLLGAILLGVLYNGLNLLKVDPFWQKVATGVIIIIAVVLDGIRNLNKE